MAHNFDRTVHGKTANGEDIARYDRSGKWYVESAAGESRRAVSVQKAAELAVAGRVFENRYGGTVFNARVRQLREAR